MEEQTANEGMVPLSFRDYVDSFFNIFIGPSRREVELSKQRKELLERAEHAETSAFEALAETNELKNTLEQAHMKIRELETELTRRHSQ
jgi:hypothetical protein